MGAKIGHEVSAETRAKISATLRGRSNGRQGYVTPEETRTKISATLAGRRLSPATRAKMSERLGPKSSQWKGDDATAEAKHMWLVKHHPKSGRCDECGAEGKTQYAFMRHPAPHTRDRSDYRELCDACHRAFDRWMRSAAPPAQLRPEEDDRDHAQRNI